MLRHYYKQVTIYICSTQHHGLEDTSTVQCYQVAVCRVVEHCHMSSPPELWEELQSIWTGVGTLLQQLLVSYFFQHF